MHPKDISIADYTYTLPTDRIAAFPLADRDASKLLVFKNHQVKEDTYHNIAACLPENSLLIFNNTKVIPARILFQKPTGGIIEIFCLEPYGAVTEYTAVMAKTESVCWKCMIGGAGKWRQGPLTKTFSYLNQQVTLTVVLIKKLADAYVVKLSWVPAQLSFAELITAAGEIPLPPYIKRKAETTDKQRYQTIYAAYDGSVAAPTAGLHFTEAVFSSLHKKNITTSFVTLHVGAGTFKPVKAGTMQQHEMHAEWMEVSSETIAMLAQNMGNTIVAVGTTSLRTMESLYWMGVKTIMYPGCAPDKLFIRQWDVYDEPLVGTQTGTKTALLSLLKWMDDNGFTKLVAPTQILIAPGYHFKIAKAIITNFHQPQSTLLLLVAAAVGKEWKKIYEYALENNFRFLSYGDGSLLLIDPENS